MGMQLRKKFVERLVRTRSGTKSAPVVVALTARSVPLMGRPLGAGRVLLVLQWLRAVTSVRGSAQVGKVVRRSPALV